MSWAEVNKINSDMTTPLNTTLGKRQDAASTGAGAGLFGWIKSIHNHLTANLSSTRMAQIDIIRNNIGYGGVRSIQRGISSGGNIDNAVINIGTIVPQRSIVLINGDWGQSQGAPATPYLLSLTATQVTIAGVRLTGTRWFSWQIIEYI